jgi:hypothetical protein
MFIVPIRVILLRSRKTFQPVTKSYLLGRYPMLQLFTIADKIGPGLTPPVTVNTICRALRSVSKAREAGQQ